MNYLLSALNMSRSEAGQGVDDSRQANPEESAAESPPAPVAVPKMQVMLRIRAVTPPVESESQADIYLVDDPASLLVRNSNANDNARKTKAGDDAAFKKFSFDRIFGPQVDQSQLFSEAVEARLADFLNSGQNCSVVSYGSADAGKTYSLFGPSGDPGIVPRSIEFVFSSIDCTASPRFKPEHSQGALRLDEADRHLESEVRKKLTSCRAIDRAACDKAYSALQACRADRRRETIAVGRSTCSLWISFIEIYNDSVHDLLEVDEEGKNMPLKLSTDKHGSTYVQGMRSVCVTSGLEAYEILNAGQTRLSTAVSASNYKSSRSHSIFTMRLLKYEEDSSASSVQTSTISFYDLAATGKLPKSASSDKQLKESRSINTSLLAFGRCLKALAEGHSRQSSGPFRDSKLTRLFQRSLRKENLIILINLNPSLELFAETQNVLNFASTAMKLTHSEFSREDKRFVDSQTELSSPKLIREAATAPSPIVPKTRRDRDFHEIAMRNKQLLDQIKQLKAAELTKEYKLRQDLADFYKKQLSDLEEIWKNRMSVAEEEKEHLVKFSVDRVESYYRSRLDEQLRRKRQKAHKESMDKASDPSSALDQDNAKVSTLERLLKSAKEENELLSVQNKQYVCEIAWLKDNLKRITDLIGSTEKYDEDGDDDLIVNDFSAKNLQYFNNDTISHIQSILGFVKDSYAKEEAAKAPHCTHSDLTLLEQHSKKIEALLRSSDVSLPEIDDSLGLSNEGVHPKVESNVGDLIERLSRIERFVVECLSQRSLLEVELNKQEEELRLLRRTNEQKDIDLLRMSEQYTESESARLLLLNKCESLEVAVKSREFFKNPDFDADESENSLSCVCHRELISLKEGNYETSMLDSSLANTESKPSRSNSDSSNNDSGVAFTLDSIVRVSGEEKDCQTDSQWDEDQHEILKDKLMQLNVDYNRMEAQHSQGSRRITELSSELERISEAMLQLKENTNVKDRTISECQNKLHESKAQIDRLSAEKKELEAQFDELRDNLVAVSKDYERKLDDSQVQLRLHQDGEYRAARCLKDYWEKSVYLGCQLSMAYVALEKLSLSCYREHVLRIHKLEEELREKEVSLAKLNEQMAAYEKDLAETIGLSGKVEECEAVLSQLQKQKAEMRQAIADRSKSQLIIQNQLENVTRKIGERDDQIASLKWQLETIVKANSSNSRKAKELGRQVTKLIEKMCTMKEDIAESETARTDLERKSTKEIDNLRARLTIFEGNADLLNVIRNSDESKQCEMDKLKLKVLEKEKELEFFKKNRNATIRRYECLVKQLQKSLKMNVHSSRSKKTSSAKLSYCLNDSKETMCCYVHDSDSQAYHWEKDQLEVRDQTESVVCLSRRDSEMLGPNGSFQHCIEESRCITDFCGRQN